MFHKNKEAEKKKAYEDFYKKNYKKIYYFCTARGQSYADADEIAAEALIRLHNIWDERWAAQEDENLKWLYVTAQNIIYEYGRINEKHKTEPMSELFHMADEVDIEQQTVEREQYSIYLDKIKNFLGKEEWKLFSMVFIEGMTYQEIREKLPINQETLSSRIYRLKKKLKLHLKRSSHKNK